MKKHLLKTIIILTTLLAQLHPITRGTKTITQPAAKPAPKAAGQPVAKNTDIITTVETKIEKLTTQVDATLTSPSLNALFKNWFFNRMEENQKTIEEQIYSKIDSASKLSPDAQKALKAQYKLKYLKKHYKIIDGILPKVKPIPAILHKLIGQNAALKEIDQKVYEAYMKNFESIYTTKQLSGKVVDVPSLISNCDNNQRFFINIMKSTIKRFKHPSINTMFAAWLDVIKEKMKENKNKSRENKDLLIAQKTEKEKIVLEPEYELLWLKTHYHIVNKLIEQEKIVLREFDDKLDQDKELGPACDAVQTAIEKQNYLEQFSKILLELEKSLKVAQPPKSQDSRTGM